MRVSELLVSCQNDPDRIVMLDHGNIDLYDHEDIGKAIKYSCRHVKSFLLETLNHKTTLFIELKGEEK